ncbi:MAG: helix-turn-helix transcriptional regulator [Eubacterium sp.]|nr:helix-turn-helix transcriptional regulator [Eubacterium sp.]
MDLSEKLKYLRKKSCLTQQQVADSLGIKRCTYTYYEIGKSRPKLETLKMLARLYNTNVDLLLDDYGSSEKELSSPDIFEEYQISDKFNQLSDYEKTVLLKVRLMSFDEKEKLMEYLNNGDK